MKEKYISEAMIRSNPVWKLGLIIRDGSITTKKLADGAVTKDKLADDVRAFVRSVTINGKTDYPDTNGNVSFNLIPADNNRGYTSDLERTVTEMNGLIEDLKRRLSYLESLHRMYNVSVSIGDTHPVILKSVGGIMLTGDFIIRDRDGNEVVPTQLWVSTGTASKTLTPASNGAYSIWVTDEGMKTIQIGCIINGTNYYGTNYVMVTMKDDTKVDPSPNPDPTPDPTPNADSIGYAGFASADSVDSLVITRLTKYDNIASDITVNNPTTGYYMWICSKKEIKNIILDHLFPVVCEGVAMKDGYYCYRSSNAQKADNYNLTISQ